MTKLSDEFIKQQYKSWWREVGENPSPEDISYLGEKLRALYVLQVAEGNLKPAAAMSTYMVRPDVAKEILAEFAGVELEVNCKTKRTDKYSAIQAWCKENVLAQVSAKEVAEIGDISYPTALKYITDHPDVFWKISRGTYEVRDPVEDRKKEKK
jgi:hypothetical protein